jgi:hypothetical protein
MILEKTLSLKNSFFFIFLSLFFISAPIALTLLYYQSEKAKRLKDPEFVIKEIKTHTIKRDTLPDDYFAEVLNLSKDKPTNIAAIDLKQAEQRLKKNGVIHSAHLKIEGHTLLIDYAMRNPLATLIDYENTLIDAEGVIFREEPYFLKRRLPEICLGLKPYGEEHLFGEAVQNESKKLTFWLLKTLSQTVLGETTRLIRIDSSKAFAKSLGEQEVVVTLEEKFQAKGVTVFIRLNPETLEEGIEHYAVLREYLGKKKQEKDLTVDLRLEFGLIE